MIAGRFLLVCIGGAIGTAARYLTALWVPTLPGTLFPFATLIINALGSFLIAFIMQVSSSTELISPDLRTMLTTGVMGGFTLRALSGEQMMVRIFFGESDRWRHRPLETTLLERLRKEGFAGATVFRGVSGFGANSIIHTTHLLDGLVRIEKVRVLRYRASSV